MGVILTGEQVRKQSEAVFAQFGESKWLPFAKTNAALIRRDAHELANVGIGKVLTLVTMGESLEGEIETLKKYRDRTDIACNDKAFAFLMERGITPDYVIICDCNIPFRWIEKWVDKTEGIKLLATPYANPEWTTAWKGPRYFYVNRDAIDSDRKFLPIFGMKTRTIPAGSNVSNAMLVFFTGMDERSKVNWSGYEQYLLVGYDYSWRPTGKYYAFDDPVPKRFYMHHRTMIDMNFDMVFTSENLLFSAKWLYSYITNFHLNAVNCSGRGILDIPLKSKLEKNLSRINPDKAKRAMVRDLYESMKAAYVSFKRAEQNFQELKEGLIYDHRS
jgi:hypothetical protein